MKQNHSSTLQRALAVFLSLLMALAMAAPAFAADAVTQVTSFEELNDAILQQKTQIRFAADFSYPETGDGGITMLTPVNHTMTLDLAGHTVHGNLYALIVGATGVLTLKDSVGGGLLTGESYCVESDMHHPGGTITINSGTYESYGAITVAMHDQEGHLLINGGTFLVSAPPDANTGRWSLNSYATDTVVKGGFFTREIDVRYAPYALQGGYYAQNPAKWIAYDNAWQAAPTLAGSGVDTAAYPYTVVSASELYAVTFKQIIDIDNPPADVVKYYRPGTAITTADLPATLNLGYLDLDELYGFAGWFLDENGTQPFGSGVTVNSNMTVYGKYDHNVVSLTVDFGGVIDNETRSYAAGVRMDVIVADLMSSYADAAPGYILRGIVPYSLDVYRWRDDFDAAAAGWGDDTLVRDRTVYVGWFAVSDVDLTFDRDLCCGTAKASPSWFLTDETDAYSLYGTWAEDFTAFTGGETYRATITIEPKMYYTFTADSVVSSQVMTVVSDTLNDDESLTVVVDITPAHYANDNSRVTRTPADAATCTTDSTVRVDTYCAGCDAVIVATTVEAEPGTALNHSYALSGWSWNDDLTVATATFACVRGDDSFDLDADSIETIPVDAATCTGDATRKFCASVSYGGRTYTNDSDVVSVPGTALGHDYRDRWEWNDDYSATVTLKCAVCQATETITVANEDMAQEIRQAPTEHSAGRVAYIATVTVDGKTFTSSHETQVPALEHVHRSAGEPTAWHWAEDYSSCVAVFVCDGCGCEYEREATVTKEWQGDGPDENGRGNYYFIASVWEEGKTYYDFTGVFTEQGNNICKWCGKAHGDGFFEKLVAFFHRLFAAIFGAKY